jgi:GT2 family glycosyltransferase
MIQKNLTILIILYQENIDIVKKCLDQLKKFKVIIIDNANDIELKNKLTDDYDIHKYFLNKRNVGFAKAANQGIQECDTEYMFLLGADCITSFEDIEKLMSAKEKYKNCFLTSPTFYNSNGEHDFNGGPLYEEGLSMSILKNFGDVCVNTVLTTAILFKIQDIKNIGLFDEEFFLYFLDFDMCRRIRNENKVVIQVYDSKAIHTHGTLKIKNRLKKIFFRNYYFEYEELYYLYKVNMHLKKFNELKKKIPNYCFKLFLNLIILRLDKFTYYLAKILAFMRFKKFTK